MLVIAGGSGAAVRQDVQTTSSTAAVGSDERVTDRPQVTECNYTGLSSSVSTGVVEVAAHNKVSAWEASGWIYEINDSGAYIVTNWHVAELDDPTDIDVGFEGGRWAEATVVGANEPTDIAVIRVENVPESATTVPVSRDSIERGQEIAVFGSPLFYEETVTGGIVSGVNRSLTYQNADDVTVPTAPMIQTDASIEFGSSGGPWVNCQGEVVGMTVAGPTSVTNFGISSRALRVIVPAIIADGSYPLSYIGAGTIDVDATVAEVNDIDTTRGVMVANLTANSPARNKLRPATAVSKGIRQYAIPVGGDVILAVDGVPVEDTADLYTYLYLETRPNETVTFTVLRNGERQRERVTVGEYPVRPPQTSTTTRATFSETTMTQSTTALSSTETMSGRR
nr:trypsin-like peptidase domain-containing protein [Haladaptatus sp. DYF46]